MTNESKIDILPYNVDPGHVNNDSEILETFFAFENFQLAN